MRSAQDLNLLKGLAAAVKARRADLGISQEELAHRAGLNRTFIGKIETAKNQPSLTAFFALSAGLSCSPEVFVEDINKRFKKELRAKDRGR